MEVLRELGFKTAAMALKKGFGEHRRSGPSWRRSAGGKAKIEGDGLAAETIANYDYTVVMIPMTHGVDSLSMWRRRQLWPLGAGKR